MKAALLGLLESKKFWTLIIGAIVWAGAKWGFAVNEQTLTTWSEAVMVLLGAQGLADFGKGAKAATTVPTAVSATSLSSGQAP